MKLKSLWAMSTFGCIVLAASTTVAASAQVPKPASSDVNYIVKLKVTQADTPDGKASRKLNVIAGAAYWDNLYNLGKVALLGSAQDGDATYRVIILEGVNGDEARTMANSDPNVKAGAVTAEIIPMHVNLIDNSRPRMTARR
jgi:uncharacterized protein YciI